MSGIGDPSQYYFKDGLWTFDGSVWRPQSQLFGVRSGYHEAPENGDAASGTNYVNGSTVPAGEIWVVTAIAAVNFGTAACVIKLHAGPSGSEIQMDQTDYYTPTRAVFRALWLPLIAGDRARAEFQGCTLHDRVVLELHGFKFKVAE